MARCVNSPADWRKHEVACEQCGAPLMRRLYRPYDGKRIARFFCDRTCKGAWQLTTKPATREWLFEQYVTLGRTANDIAKEVGRDAKRVWEWLRDYGIETRPRGSNEARHFKPGAPSLWKGCRHTEEVKQRLREQRRLDGSKSLFRDGVHVLKGRFGAAHPRFKGGLTPERQSFYSSDEWKAACVAVWHRADAKCERCDLDSRSVDRRIQKFHVHHIVSFQVRKLRADPSNLALLCAACHRWVHSRANVTKEFIRDAA